MRDMSHEEARRRWEQGKQECSVGPWGLLGWATALVATIAACVLIGA